MNERIKLLAEQAGIYKLNLSDETEYWIIEKFAELIIIDVCNTLSEISNDDRIEKTTTDHMTKLFNGILKHVSEFLKEKYNV
jgi:hypothetical protein